MIGYCIRDQRGIFEKIDELVDHVNELEKETKKGESLMEPIRHYDEISSIRDDISKELKKTRESSLVITKLDEALMWLDRYYAEDFGGEE